MTGGAVLAELAGLGPYFALDAHPAGSAPLGGWRPLEELLHQPGALEAWVASVRAALAEISGRPPADVELRVAASMAQLGLAARLICPPLGMAVLTGRLLPMDPARLRWRPGPGGAVGLSIRDDALPPWGSPWKSGVPESSSTASPATLADALVDVVLDGPVRALVEAGTRFAVSPQVLWGNVASIVNGVRALIGTAEPALTGRTEELVSRLLSQPPLHGTHDTHQATRDPDQGSTPAVGFRRRSCCLVYRLAPAQAPVCGDCVLDRGPAPASREAAAPG